MKRIAYIVLIIGILLIFHDEAIHSEEAYFDMTASVVVQPAFKISLDNANINFGYTDPGKTIELYPAKSYNEVKCVSNKGVTWYLKISVMENITKPINSKVGVDSFKWMVDSATGDGVKEPGWHSFTVTPAQVYTSGTRDSSGEEVVVRFKYRLDMPKDAVGGNYGLNVVYTMTDVP